jgi:hypothetical protein
VFEASLTIASRALSLGCARSVAVASFSLHFSKAEIASGVQLIGDLPFKLGTKRSFSGAFASEASGIKRR